MNACTCCDLTRGGRSRQFEYGRLNEFGGGGAVAPARICATSIGVTDTMEIRWRGHGGGAGLATGLTIGGLVAGPRNYDGPYPYYGGLYPAGYVGRSAMSRRGGRPLLVALSPVRSDERHLSGPRWPTALLPVVRPLESSSRDEMREPSLWDPWRRRKITPVS